MSHLHEQQLNIIMSPSTTAESGYTIELIHDYALHFTCQDSINLGKHEVRVQLDIPDRMELAQLAIDTLREKQRTIAAEAYKRQQELETKIESLLLIGMDS